MNKAPSSFALVFLAMLVVLSCAGCSWKFTVVPLVTATPVVATPVISPTSGIYSTVQSVTISDAISGATIYYTTNGTIPTTSPAVYSGPLTVASSETVEAMATAPGDSASAVAIASYVISLVTPTVATPVFSPPAGTYTAAQSVTISDATPGAVIYYTTNATTPTTASTLYTGPITVSTTELVEAIAIAPGYSQSAVASAQYNLPQAADPTFSPVGGSFSSAQTVTILDSTPGAVIYYAVNAPATTSSTLYTGPITVSSSETLYAMATAPGYAPSGEGIAFFTITLPVTGVSDWTWMGGSKITYQSSVYGSLGIASTVNVPGARYGAASWTDANGNFWLFGGEGVSSADYNALNDLWEYQPAAKTWTWVSGGQGGNEPGVYGTMGIASAGNVPGGRLQPATWVDSSGNLWLFGGSGYDSTGSYQSILNDLWEFNPTTSQWIWMGGSNIVGAAGNYGTQGIPAAVNVPGARWRAMNWTDTNGNFWLFGGVGAVNGADIIFNDLWEFNLQNKEWVWVSGSSSANAKGVYGTEGVASSNNVPGARALSATWVDKSNNLWLFAGDGYDASGNEGYLDDVWKFNVTTLQWSWVSGSETRNGVASYGAQGIALPSNDPGGRSGVVSWRDGNGNFWLFGGSGYGLNESFLADLWEFNPVSGDWIWIAGSSQAETSGNYGMLGVAAATNVPGARFQGNGWTDSSGDFWLFGGIGYDSTGKVGYLNDLWQYQP